MSKSEIYITDLKKAIGLGTNHAGLHHWKWQRISAVALVILFSWFIYLLLLFFNNHEYVINNILYAPFSLLFFAILINVSLYHGVLGFKVICEDYIHNEFIKATVVILSYFITLITMAAITFALILNFIVNL